MNLVTLRLLASKNSGSYTFAILGFLMVLLFTSHNGIGISPDSIVYLSVAKNMVAHGLFIDYNLQPLVDFPVFYPFFLSIIGFFTQGDLLAVAPYINGVMFAACLLIIGYLVDYIDISTSLYKYLLLLTVALSPALMNIYSMLWSETLFILLTLFFFATFNKYLIKRSVLWLLCSASIAGIACIIRYAGITLIATGLMVLLFDPSLKLKKKVINFLLFAAVSGTILIANLVRNMIITGLMTGPRETGITPLITNIGYYATVVCSWLSIPNSNPLVCTIIVMIIFLIMVVLFFETVLLNSNFATVPNILRAFFIVYTVFIIGISTLSHFEQINNRLLSPLIIPLLIILTYWIPDYITRFKGKRRLLIIVFLSVIVFSFEGFQLKQFYKEYQGYTTYGIPGYTDDGWQKSAIVKFLKSHPGIFDKNYSIYSNAHEAAYFNGGIQSASIPHQIDKADIDDFFTDGGQYIIWFNHVNDKELITLAQISARATVTKKYEFKDGTIFFVVPVHKN